MGAVASLEVGTEPQLREDRTRAQRSTGRLSAAGTERRRTNRRVPGVLLPVTCDRGFSTPDSRAPTSETQHAASKVDSASADSSEPTGSLETKPLWVRQSVNQAAGDQRRFWNPVGRNGLSALLPGGPSRRAICTGMLPAVLPTPRSLAPVRSALSFSGPSLKVSFSLTLLFPLHVLPGSVGGCLCASPLTLPLHF